MNKLKLANFIDGLRLLSDDITGCSFYNSSAGDAVFHLSAALPEGVVGELKALGWEYSSDPVRDNHWVAFSEWSTI